MRKFIIEDEAHADSLNEYLSLDEAIVELQRLSSIPWNEELISLRVPIGEIVDVDMTLLNMKPLPILGVKFVVFPH